ncbi:macro domain-containing protein [Candidatus Poribacteria bacterium]|nr:macro domain-containing protein [Candidatus Poribacteria bacterium]
MIQYVVGDILTSDAQTIVNTVNCKGVMGKGLAKQFKRKYPDMFREYWDLCMKKKIRIGRPHLYMKSQPWILNFPTKDDWRKSSLICFIEQGLQWIIENYKAVGIQSIAFPKLGCNNGGLDWEEVRQIMHNYLSQLEIPVWFYVEFPAEIPQQERIHTLTGMSGQPTVSPDYLQKRLNLQILGEQMDTYLDVISQSKSESSVKT